MDDLIHLKMCRAKARKIFLESKKQSWENFETAITPATPPKIIWDKIRKIKGSRRTNHISTLIKDGNIISTPQTIVDILADTLQYNSNDMNYSPEFREYKNNVEKENFEIQPLDHEINNPFSKHELKQAINKLKENKCPGPDGITSEIIKNLPDSVLEYMLELYNHMWTNSLYPKQWKEVITFPIPKPNKDQTNPDNYRPISASNNLSKIL